MLKGLVNLLRQDATFSNAARRLTMPAGEYRTERDDEAMLAIMARVVHAGSSCMDVGASEGRFLNEILRFSPHGRHFAFEPIPHLASKLRLRFPQVQILPCALSDRVGTGTFHHAVNLEGWSGLRRQQYPVETPVNEIEVPVCRIDDIVPLEAVVHFMKIDVEGAELHVLRGARDTVRRCRPHIIFEYAEIHGLEYETRPEDLYDHLTAECGLVVRSILGSRRRFSRDGFIRICRRATALKYGHSAETNFYAGPE